MSNPSREEQIEQVCLACFVKSHVAFQGDVCAPCLTAFARTVAHDAASRQREADAQICDQPKLEGLKGASQIAAVLARAIRQAPLVEEEG